MNDAILIGKGTLQKDNPFLDCTLPGLENCMPKKIILDSIGNINDPELNIFKKGEVWSFGAKNNFQHENFKNFQLPIQENNKVDIKNLVSKLAELGINNLLIEGGNAVATEFLKESLIDKIIWFRANKIAGNDAIASFGDLHLDDVNNFYNFSKKHSMQIGDNTMDVLLKKPMLLDVFELFSC
jgi:diaminohydroxyphosphoribosylaminopyrimidine deaminase/5-amino-6-(5-phosphoribosylamino)uracil reductase